jgi:hypothetical protein
LKDYPENLFPLIFDVLNWGIAHYGVRPYRLLLATLAIFLLGTVIFSGTDAVIPLSEKQQVVVFSGPRVVIRHNEPATLDPVGALAVSLDVLLPLELPAGAGGEWQPSDCYIRIGTTGACQPAVVPAITYAAYATVQRLVGWVVVPLGIATLTGLLNRRPAGGPANSAGSREG